MPKHYPEHTEAIRAARQHIHAHMRELRSPFGRKGYGRMHDALTDYCRLLATTQPADPRRLPALALLAGAISCGTLAEVPADAWVFSPGATRPVPKGADLHDAHTHGVAPLSVLALPAHMRNLTVAQRLDAHPRLMKHLWSQRQRYTEVLKALRDHTHASAVPDPRPTLSLRAYRDVATYRAVRLANGYRTSMLLDPRSLPLAWGHTGPVAMALPGGKVLDAARPVPWKDEEWWLTSTLPPQHLTTLSRTRDGKVAYVQSTDKLLRYPEPLFTVLAPGAYLKRFFGAGTEANLSDEQIKYWANACAAAVRAQEVKVRVLDNDDPKWCEAGGARALQDEWYRLYSQVQTDYSCMRGSHGVRAYGLPGNHLGLAYLERGDGTLMCRAIVHDLRGGSRRGNESDPEYVDPLTKPWSFHRCFPYYEEAEDGEGLSIEQVASLFAQRGWTEEIDLDGAWLATIDADDRRMSMPDHVPSTVYCPYLDGETVHVDTYREDECGNPYPHAVMRVCGSGEYEANDTGGTLEVGPDGRCDDCGCACDEDELNPTYHEEQVCDDCVSNYTRVRSRYGAELVADDQLDEHAVYCESDDEWYLNHSQVLEHHGIMQCTYSGDWYSMDDLVATEDGLVSTDDAVELLVPDPYGNEYAHPDFVTRITRVGAYGEVEEAPFHDDTVSDEAEYAEHVQPWIDYPHTTYYTEGAALHAHYTPELPELIGAYGEYIPAENHTHRYSLQRAAA